MINEALALLDWLYAEASMFLERKHKRYTKIKNRYAGIGEQLEFVLQIEACPHNTCYAEQHI